MLPVAQQAVGLVHHQHGPESACLLEHPRNVGFGRSEVRRQQVGGATYQQRSIERAREVSAERSAAERPLASRSLERNRIPGSEPKAIWMA